MLLGLKPAAGGEVFLQTALGGGGGVNSSWKTAPSSFPRSKMAKSGEYGRKTPACIGQQAGSKHPCYARVGPGTFLTQHPCLEDHHPLHLQQQTPDICFSPMSAEDGAAKSIASLYPELSTHIPP